MAKTRPHVFRLTLSSDPKNVRKVEQFLRRINRHRPLDEIQFHKLMVSLTEAVNNAIVHGNKADPTKTVEVRCELLDSVVQITVKDQGDGFRPETVDNPLKEENLLRESGRGIFLMRTLMDRVEFDRTDEGMELELWLDLKK